MARQKQKINIRIHIPANPNALFALQKHVAEAHAREVERKINAMNLTHEQRKRLIDCILASLRAREAGGKFTPLPQ